MRCCFAEWIIRMDQFGEMSKTKEVAHAETRGRGASGKRWYNRHLFQQRAPLFVQDPPPRRSTLFPSPKLLGYASASIAQAVNEGGMSGGHFESLTPVNMYEVQNILVSAQVIPDRKKAFVFHGRT